MNSVHPIKLACCRNLSLDVRVSEGVRTVATPTVETTFSEKKLALPNEYGSGNVLNSDTPAKRPEAHGHAESSAAGIRSARPHFSAEDSSDTVDRKSAAAPRKVSRFLKRLNPLRLFKRKSKSKTKPRLEISAPLEANEVPEGSISDLPRDSANDLPQDSANGLLEDEVEEMPEDLESMDSELTRGVPLGKFSEQRYSPLQNGPYFLAETPADPTTKPPHHSPRPSPSARLPGPTPTPATRVGSAKSGTPPELELGAEIDTPEARKVSQRIEQCGSGTFGTGETRTQTAMDEPVTRKKESTSPDNPVNLIPVTAGVAPSEEVRFACRL